MARLITLGRKPKRRRLPAGWYRAPYAPDRLLYWDGSRWVDPDDPSDPAPRGSQPLPRRPGVSDPGQLTARAMRRGLVAGISGLVALLYLAEPLTYIGTRSEPGSRFGVTLAVGAFLTVAWVAILGRLWLSLHRHLRHVFQTPSAEDPDLSSGLRRLVAYLYLTVHGGLIVLPPFGYFLGVVADRGTGTELSTGLFVWAFLAFSTIVWMGILLAVAAWTHLLPETRSADGEPGIDRSAPPPAASAAAPARIEVSGRRSPVVAVVVAGFVGSIVVAFIGVLTMPGVTPSFAMHGTAGAVAWPVILGLCFSSCWTLVYLVPWLLAPRFMVQTVMRHLRRDGHYEVDLRRGESTWNPSLALGGDNGVHGPGVARYVLIDERVRLEVRRPGPDGVVEVHEGEPADPDARGTPNSPLTPRAYAVARRSAVVLMVAPSIAFVAAAVLAGGTGYEFGIGLLAWGITSSVVIGMQWIALGVVSFLDIKDQQTQTRPR